MDVYICGCDVESLPALKLCKWGRDSPKPTASSRTPRVFRAPQRQFGVVGLASGGIWRGTDQPLAERDRLTVN